MNDTSAAVAVTHSFEELKRTYKALVSPQISYALFEPLDRKLRVRTRKPDLAHLKAVCLGCSAYTDTVLDDIKDRGMRTATSEELLLFLKKDPDAVLRRHAPLVALGSVAYVEGRRHVLYATRGRRGAGLLIHPFDGFYHSRFWYLVAPILPET
ncbi:MAG: hypothetical protein V1745_04855 [Patescibacteria group bacterium]